MKIVDMLEKLGVNRILIVWEYKIKDYEMANAKRRLGDAHWYLAIISHLAVRWFNKTTEAVVLVGKNSLSFSPFLFFEFNSNSAGFGSSDFSLFCSIVIAFELAEYLGSRFADVPERSVF